MDRFFRRHDHGQTRNEFLQPKWHRTKIFERGNTAETKWHYRVTSHCGYVYNYSTALADKPVESVSKVETRLLRCKKCDTAAAKLKPKP